MIALVHQHAVIPKFCFPVDLGGYAKKLPSERRHALDGHKNRVLKLLSVAHLLVAVKSNENPLDDFSSRNVADEVFDYGLVKQFKRSFNSHCSSLAASIARAERTTVERNPAIKLSRRSNSRGGKVSYTLTTSKKHQPHSTSIIARRPLRGKVEFVCCADALARNCRDAGERNQKRASNFQGGVSLRATINANAWAINQFSLANLRNEKFRGHERFGHFRAGRLLGRVQNSSPQKSDASSRGKPLASPSMRSGLKRNLQNSFGSSLQSIRSMKLFLRFAAPTAFAIVFLTPRSPTNRLRGCV